MMTFKNAVGYIRVSTKEQAGEDKFGIEAQKQSILLYANDNGYQIVKWFSDEGVSGVKEERPAFDDILFGEVTNPPFEAVIVAKSDRVARDTKLYFYYLYLLEKKNIKLISVSEKFDSDDGLANIYRSLMLFVAEQERRNIASRTSKGRRVKAHAGGYSGGRSPYGYRVQNGNLVLNDEEVPIVKMVFKGLDANKTLWAIAEELNAAGYKTRKGIPFRESNIRSIRDNRPFYEGMYKYGKDMNYVPGVHEPILRKEDE
jgi:DNA invertase Pin-like site-specific DNA recombinase